MWFSPKYSHVLKEQELESFERVIGSEHGVRLRSLQERENWFFPASAATIGTSERDFPKASTAGLYLKKHRIRLRQEPRLSAAQAARSDGGPPPGTSPGVLEAYYAVRLPEFGIPTMPVVAFGQRTSPGGYQESFFLSEELVGFTPLDLFLAQESPARAGEGRATLQRRRSLVKAVADLARRLHAAGFSHRDFYTCHIFVRESSFGKFELRLIDLQRIQEIPYPGERWLAKDLSQLWYSTPEGWLSCHERLRFLIRYRGNGQLLPADARFARRIAFRVWWMNLKSGAYP